MTFLDPSPNFGERYIENYRSLAFRLLSDASVAEWYGVQAVAIGLDGITILVQGGNEFEHGELARVAGGQNVRVRAIGRIELTSCGGERVDAKSGSWGTFGCVVENDQGREYALSCDHVVGHEARQNVGDGVFCGMSKLGSFERGTTIAMSPAGNNTTDAALVRPVSGMPLNRSIKGLGVSPRGVNRALSFGDKVKKSGARTGVTTGQCMYILTMLVPYGSGSARFVDQIGLDGGGMVFSDKGDSGAVVLDDQMRVAGLLFASAPQSRLGFANPIAAVETALGVRVP